jgi:hypothetical protein
MGKRHLQKILAAALAPCYGDPPTAAAVIIVTGGGRGVKHFSLNMEPLEVVHTLITAGMHINDSMSLHKIPEVLQ